MNNYAEEYITKATAQEVVKDVFRVDIITQEVIDTCMKCMTAIKNAPSTDARENIKGKWQPIEVQPYFKKHFDTSVACSICHRKGNKRWNFCPNCGADMRNETND